MLKTYKFLEYAAAVLILNVFFILGCVPVVTVGLSYSALICGVRYIIRKEDFFKGWLRGVKTHPGRSIITGTLGIALTAYLALNLISILTYKLEGYIVPLILTCIFLALTVMFMTALLFVNIYVPTNIKNWLLNARLLCLKFPLRLLGASVLAFVPVVIAYFSVSVTYYILMLYILVYFVIAAFASTFIMKEPLVFILVKSREEGLIENYVSPEKKKEEEESEAKAAEEEQEMLRQAYNDIISKKD